MLAATFIAIFIIPVSFYVVERLRGSERGKEVETAAASEEPPPAVAGGHRA
jgi:hypothetical protein